MKTIKVTCENGRQFSTNINGSIGEIRAYYIGNSFDLGPYFKEDFHRAVHVEFLHDYRVQVSDAAGVNWVDTGEGAETVPLAVSMARVLAHRDDLWNVVGYENRLRRLRVVHEGKVVIDSIGA
jgi:hypothetical protein